MSKVMVVEDDAALREIYGIRIAAEGYEIVSAGDGEEALAVAVREKPDLILSDVMMPKISGFDMLDILRATPETADIKVVMMTALSSDDQRLRGERLGADRYLVKSQVGIEDVVNVIHEVLGDKVLGSANAGADSMGGAGSSSAEAAAPAVIPGVSSVAVNAADGNGPVGTSNVSAGNPGVSDITPGVAPGVPVAGAAVPHFNPGVFANMAPDGAGVAENAAASPEVGNGQVGSADSAQ